ncbi:MAG: hypothetical protein JWN78_2121 [Bacteroidota bacterium]|nr:hypothetical protein [Bacteroidota bacterium]
MKAKKFFNKRLVQIEQLLLLFCKENKPETLHKFRVEIKKIKAFFLLLEHCYDQFKKDEKLKAHLKMFRRSSRIRDFDVMHDLLKENKINFVAPSTLSDTNKQRKYIKDFCDHISSYRKSLLKEKKDLKPFLKSIPKKKYQKYLLKEKEKAMEQLNSNSIEKKLHRARKHMKQILYLSKLDKRFPLEAYLYFDKLQKAVGAWHDKDMLIKSLHNAGIRNNKILVKLRKEKASDLQKIEQLKKSPL